MKNPFIAMAVMAAAMAAAMKENVYRTAGVELPGKRTRARIPGPRHPAGSKLARQFARQRGVEWNGEIFHSGTLTQANNERAIGRLGRGQ